MRGLRGGGGADGEMKWVRRLIGQKGTLMEIE